MQISHLRKTRGIERPPPLPVSFVHWKPYLKRQYTGRLQSAPASIAPYVRNLKQGLDGHADVQAKGGSIDDLSMASIHS